MTWKKENAKLFKENIEYFVQIGYLFFIFLCYILLYLKLETYIGTYGSNNYVILKMIK